ncbi:HAD family hydrolase [Clavibacter michiganensis]|uniref:HAD family hydrolase n=1 Tax=Clavibacter michiganensis TaxID=28447 RepID=UPI00292EDD3E|nr:HAD family hydrolase [Clavibacter michiganensis]
MPVLLDLDNTLVDRDGAFSSWSARAVVEWGGDERDVRWLVDADRSGYTPRRELAQMIQERLTPPCSTDAVVDRLLYEHVAAIECYPGVIDELERMTRAGVSLVVVTNGESEQQRMKLRRTGLDRVVAASVISGELGAKKPDRRIFDAARAAAPDDGFTWMVGDHVTADMAGARAAGLSTAWVGHDRPWPETWTPDLTAGRPDDVLRLLRDRLLGCGITG